MTEGQRRLRQHIMPWLTALAHLYILSVGIWAVLYLVFGDRWWWLFSLNALSLYFFTPLPLMVPVALLVGQRKIWLGMALILAVGLYLYGDSLLSPSLKEKQGTPTLTLMTYNVLGSNEQTAQVINAIRASGADVIALQELNPVVARAVQRDLAAEYPYQVLNPQPGVTGMGTLSRYPLHATGVVLEGTWVGAPQVLELKWEETKSSVVNFHAIPPGAGANGSFRLSERERQMQALVTLAQEQKMPFVALGDLNATDLSTAYAIVTQELIDPWHLAGSGFGHTFPGAPASNAILTLRWLARIDYIFLSEHWQVVSARIGPWDGASDHRPVIAEVALSSATSAHNVTNKPEYYSEYSGKSSSVLEPTSK